MTACAIVQKHCRTYQDRSVSLKIYHDYFEQEFLAETEQFYERESDAFLATNTVTDYIKKVG